MTGVPDSLTPVIERFDSLRHDTARFSCGQLTLDDYLRHRLERDVAERTAIGYVSIDVTDPGRRIVGYFTISSFAFAKKQGRRRDQDKYLGGYGQVPAVLIGRLALDRVYQGRGLGSTILIAALKLILDTSHTLGIAVVVVHAKDDSAATFYEKHGFTRFRDEPAHLYLPLAAFAAALGS